MITARHASRLCPGALHIQQSRFLPSTSPTLRMRFVFGRPLWRSTLNDTMLKEECSKADQVRGVIASA